MTQQEIQKVFSSFNGKNVLLIGDAMIDSYIWGNPSIYWEFHLQYGNVIIPHE